MRTRLKIACLALLATAGLSCHTITELSPNPAEAGATLTISGSGFGPSQGSSVVRYDGEELSVSSWSSSTIEVVLPVDKRGGSYELSVEMRSEVVSLPHQLLASTADMAFVPQGTFFMGGPGIASSSLPVHQLYLDAYYIDLTEVTAGAFQECIDDGGCGTLSGSPGCNVGVPGRENYAANCLSWPDAEAYCAWTGKRLPTEAEWEKAARATDQRTYPWGDEAISCDYAVILDSELGSACGEPEFGGAPVGSRPLGASPYGPLDMAGNVWEIVGDWFDYFYYATSPPINPTGPATGTERTIRGGAYNWTGESGVHRSDSRIGQNTMGPLHIGFRCARDA